MIELNNFIFAVGITVSIIALYKFILNFLEEKQENDQN